MTPKIGETVQCLVNGRWVQGKIVKILAWIFFDGYDVRIDGKVIPIFRGRVRSLEGKSFERS